MPEVLKGILFREPSISTETDDTNPQDTIPNCVAGGVGIVVADGTVAAHFRAIVRGTSGIVADLTGELGSPATVEGISTLFARGRLNGEANVFGVAEIPGTSAIVADGRLTLLPRAFIGGTSAIVARGAVAGADRTDLRVTLSVIPADDAGFGDVISARISAAGVNYPIRAASYTEPSNAAGISADVTLQKPSDRDAILSAESFKFEIYATGAWNVMFDTGKRSAGGFSFAWVDGRGDDSLTISTIGPISDRINKSPLNDLTVYDPIRETLNAAEFERIYDTDGNAYARELVPIGDMYLLDLLVYIFVDRCGFSGVQSDLPNYPIRRADFSQTDTYLSGVAAHIGMFTPLIFVRDNVVWFLDSTDILPAGFAAPYQLTADKYRNAQMNESVLNADGFVVEYADATEFDYSTEREVIDDTDAIGGFGNPNYIEIDRRRTFRDFYKIANPIVPVRTEKIREVETTHGYAAGVFSQLSEMTETINLDSHGRLVSIHKETTGLVPDLATPSFPFITSTLRDERTDFSYAPMIGNPGRVVLSKTKKVVEGLIAVDTANQHLDRPFKQAFTDGFRAGNLSADITLEFGPIETIVETMTQSKRGQFEMRTRTTDFMTTPPAIRNTATDARAGDLSTNALGSTPQTIIVLRAGLGRTDAKLQSLSVGELPIKFAIPLARRILANAVNRSGSVTLKGLRLYIGRGFTFELFDRDDNSTGDYIVEGRTIALNALGTPEQNSTQTLQVAQLNT